MNALKLLEIIANNYVAVYGAGYIAERFYKALEAKNLQHKIICFIVTDCKNNTQFLGKPVVKLENIEGQDIYICIAVHESARCEIEENLQKHNRSKYIWIFPFLHELLFGEPLALHKNISTSYILKGQSADDFAIAVRYLVIDGFYKGIVEWNDIYCKMFQHKCGNKETAQNRLKFFLRLINNWDEVGYQENSEIIIDERGQFIDGMHRFTLACYHKMKFIYCTVFPYTSNYDEYMKHVASFNMKEIQEAGYTQYELDMILRAQEKLMDLYR